MSDKPPYIRSDLDTMQCQTENCAHDDHTRIRIICHLHPDAGTVAIYERLLGTILLACVQCERAICRILTATKQDYTVN